MRINLLIRALDQVGISSRPGYQTDPVFSYLCQSTLWTLVSFEKWGRYFPVYTIWYCEGEMRLRTWKYFWKCKVLYNMIIILCYFYYLQKVTNYLTSNYSYITEFYKLGNYFKTNRQKLVLTCLITRMNFLGEFRPFISAFSW